MPWRTTFCQLTSGLRLSHGATTELIRRSNSFLSTSPEPNSVARSVTCWALFENWQAEVQPSRSTVARWTTVFRAADARFADASMITLEAAKEWMTGLIDENRTAQTIATVWKTALKTVFTWAVGEKLVGNNPFK